MSKETSSKKNADGEGIKSISRSQMEKARKAALLAKKGGPIKHGGTCSSCGQSSNSCTPNTQHANCEGIYRGEFGDALFDLMAREYPMLYDGTIVRHSILGTWMPAEEIQQRRSERIQEAARLAQKKVVMTSVFEEVEPAPINGADLTALVNSGVPVTKKFVRLDVVNGLGESINWLDGAWRTPAEAVEYYTLFSVTSQVDPIPEIVAAATEEILASVSEPDPGLLCEGGSPGFLPDGCYADPIPS